MGRMRFYNSAGRTNENSKYPTWSNFPQSPTLQSGPFVWSFRESHLPNAQPPSLLNKYKTVGWGKFYQRRAMAGRVIFYLNRNC